MKGVSSFSGILDIPCPEFCGLQSLLFSKSQSYIFCIDKIEHQDYWSFVEYDHSIT